MFSDSVLLLLQFRAKGIPLSVALLPSAYPNISASDAETARKFFNQIFPNIVRTYIAYKRALLSEEWEKEKFLPPSVYVDILLLRLLLMVLLSADNYLDGYLTLNFPDLNEILALPPRELLERYKDFKVKVSAGGRVKVSGVPASARKGGGVKERSVEET